MTELFGFLSVSETYGDEDRLSAEELQDIMRRVREILKGAGLNLQYVNGTPFVQTALCTNHRTDETAQIIGAFRQTAETASGSWGVLYLRDDEDPAHRNEAVRYTFKRGTCTVCTDSDFSPCIPEIEAPI